MHVSTYAAHDLISSQMLSYTMGTDMVSHETSDVDFTRLVNEWMDISSNWVPTCSASFYQMFWGNRDIWRRCFLPLPSYMWTPGEWPRAEWSKRTGIVLLELRRNSSKFQFTTRGVWGLDWMELQRWSSPMCRRAGYVWNQSTWSMNLSPVYAASWVFYCRWNTMANYSDDGEREGDQ